MGRGNEPGPQGRGFVAETHHRTSLRMMGIASGSGPEGRLHKLNPSYKENSVAALKACSSMLHSRVIDPADDLPGFIAYARQQAPPPAAARG